GYATLETVEWLGGSRDFNELLIAVDQRQTDQEYVSQVAKAEKRRLEDSGVKVNTTSIFMPGRHWAFDQIQAMLTIVEILGWMSVFLNAFLMVNSIDTLMAQQVRYIGVMKAIGGRTRQILAMYLALVLCMG